MTRVREYGTAGPWVVLLHGGPGAPGHMAPVARGLAGAFRVLEPYQRGSVPEELPDLEAEAIRARLRFASRRLEISDSR